jgi:hypothetical protein
VNEFKDCAQENINTSRLQGGKNRNLDNYGCKLKPANSHLNRITTGLFCILFLQMFFCAYCTLQSQGKIIGEEHLYRNKVIYMSFLLPAEPLPEKYKSGIDKKSFDSLSTLGYKELYLDSTGKYHCNAPLSWSQMMPCPNKADCSLNIWPNFIRIKVYDQSKLSYTIDTILRCSECTFAKSTSSSWDLIIPDLYLK